MYISQGFRFCCGCRKGPSPEALLVSLPKPQTSSSCLLIELNHKKRPQIDFTNLNKNPFFQQTFNCLRSTIRTRLPFFSPREETHALWRTHCVLYQRLSLYAMIYIDENDDLSDIDDTFAIPPSRQFTLLLSAAPEQHAIPMTWYVWVIPQKASPSISNAIKQSQTIKDNIPIISMEIRNGTP